MRVHCQVGPPRSRFPYLVSLTGGGLRMSSPAVRHCLQALGLGSLRLSLGLGLAAGVFLATTPEAWSRSPRNCNTAPTGVQASDEFVQFQVPSGLMPDPRFDGRTAT